MELLNRLVPILLIFNLLLTWLVYFDLGIHNGDMFYMVDLAQDMGALASDNAEEAQGLINRTSARFQTDMTLF